MTIAIANLTPPFEVAGDTITLTATDPAGPPGNTVTATIWLSAIRNHDGAGTRATPAQLAALVLGALNAASPYSGAAPQSVTLAQLATL